MTGKRGRRERGEKTEVGEGGTGRTREREITQRRGRTKMGEDE